MWCMGTTREHLCGNGCRIGAFVWYRVPHEGACAVPSAACGVPQAARRMRHTGPVLYVTEDARRILVRAGLYTNYA